MSITIELPAEVERKLRAVANDPKAAQRILSDEVASLTSMALAALDDAPVLPQPKRLTSEEFKAIYEDLIAVMKDHPTIYSGTYTREEIYEDHL